MFWKIFLAVRYQPSAKAGRVPALALLSGWVSFAAAVFRFRRTVVARVPSGGSAIAPRPQAAAPGPKGAYPPLSAASAGQPQRRRSLPSRTLRNKVSALALFALALSALPAAQAQAQAIIGQGTIREDVRFGADSDRIRGQATLPADGTQFVARSFRRRATRAGGTSGNIGGFGYDADGRWQFELNPRRDQLPIIKALSDGEVMMLDYRVVYRISGGGEREATIRVNIQGVTEAVTGPRNFSFNENQNNNGSNSQVSGVLNWQFGDVIRNVNNAGQVRVANNNNPSGDFGIWTPARVNGTYGVFFMDTSRGNWRYIFHTNRDATQNLQADAAPADRFSIAPYTDRFATVDFVFTVNGQNDLPVVTVAQADQSMVRPGEVVQLTGAATDRDSSEQDTLAYLWTVTPAVGTFADATDPNTTWTAPATIHEEDYVLTLRARDVSGGSASRSVRVNGNSVPQFSTRYTPPAYTFRAGLNVNRNTAALPLARFGDAPLQYRLTPALPPGLSLNDINDIFGTPLRSLNAQTYTWTVTDANGDSDAMDFTITVITAGMPNPAPGFNYLSDPDSDFYGQVSEVAGNRVVAGLISFRNAAGRSVGRAVADEMVSGQYGTLTITDPEGDDPRWSYRVDHTNADVLNLPAGVRLRETLTPACQPSPRSGDPDLCYTINIDIIGVNQPPGNVQAQVFNPQSGNFGGSVSAAQGSILQLRGRAGDRDTGEADTLTYIWSVNPTAIGGTFADRNDPDTTYTVGTRGAGVTYTLSLLVRDQSGGSASDTVTVIGTAAPVALTGELTAAIDADRNTAAGGTVSHPLQDSRQQGVYGSFAPSANTWEYNLNSTSDVVRALPLGRIVRDRFIAYPAQLLNIRGAPVIVTITGVNDPPMANTQRDGLRVAAGETISVDGGVSLDPDDGETETLTYAWSAVPDTAGSFADRSARVVRWTAPNPRPAAGFIALRLTVTDVHGASDNIIANIEIDPAVPAIIGDLDSGAVTENDATNTATGTLQYINPPATGGTDFSVPSPTGRYGSLAITTAGVWTYALDNADPDTEALLPNQMMTDTIAVRAGTGATSTTTGVTITITGANDLPVVQITAPATNLTRSSGVAVTVTATATDVDAHERPLRFLWVTEPAGQGVFRNPNALTTTWTAPAVTAQTTVDVAFRATDQAGASNDGAARTITVNPVTVAGSRDIIGIGRISENTDFGNDNERITGTFTNPPGITRYGPDRENVIRRNTVDGGSNDFGLFGYTNAGVWTFELDPRNDAFRIVNELREGQTMALDYPVIGNSGGGAASQPVGVARIVIRGRAEPVTGARRFTFNEDQTAAGGRNVRESGQLNWNLGGLLRVGGGQSADRGNPLGTNGLWTPATITGAYGQFQMEDTRGNWNYVFFNGRPQTQALQAADAPVDRFTIAPYTDLYQNVVFEFTIRGANDAPVLTVARADRAIVRPGEVVQLSGAATDADNNEQRSLVYTWLASPAAGTFADRNDPDTTWTAPDPLVEDFYTLSLRVHDQNGASDTISVRINGDTTPQFGTRFTPMAYTFQADRNIAPHTAPLPAATGGDGALTYFITPALPPGVTFDSEARELGGRPLVRLDAVRDYTYRVTDANGDADTMQFTITIVSDFAAAPPRPSRYIGGALSGRVRDVSGERVARGAFSLHLPNGAGGAGGFFPDDDQDGVYGTLEVRGRNWNYQLLRTRGATVNLPGGGRAFETFTIAANDRDLYPDATLTIEVTGTNEAPTARAAVAAGVIGTALAGEPIQVVGTGDDADTGDVAALSYAWSVTPTALGGSFSDRTASETFYFVGSRGAGATYTLTLRVTDTSGASATDTFVVRQASEESSRLTGDLSARIGEDDGQISSTVSHILNEVDETGTGGLGRLMVNDASNRWRYFLRPAAQALAENQERVNTFTLTPVDTTVSPANLVITVVGANDAPVARIDAPSGLPRVVAGTVVTLDATATDVDTDDQMLYQWRAVPDLGTFVDATALDTTWTAPATLAAGFTEVTLSLTVSDGVTGPDGNLVSGRLSDTAQLVIGVTESTDVAPTLPEFADQTYLRGVAVSVTLPAAGGGNGALSYALSPVPPGMTFNADTRVLSGSPTLLTAAGNPNEHTYSVTDSPVAPATSGDTVEDVFVITIIADPGPPSFAGISVDNQSFVVGRDVNLTLPAAADGDPPLSYAFFRTAGGEGDLPPGLSFDPATRTFSGTPEEVLGRSEFTYRVTDASGRQDAIQDFDVVIATIGFAETIPDQTYAVTVPLATGSGAGALPYVQFPAAVGGSPPYRYTLLPAVPPGLNFDESTRRLSGTPTDIILAPPRHTYRVTDSENTIVDLTFDITVEEPVPYFPAVIVAFNYEETYSVGEDITPLILADALGGSGALTYSLSLNSDGSGGLPDGLTFDAGAQTLSGRPTTGQVQTTYFYVATDVDGNRSLALNVDIRIEGAGDTMPVFADGTTIDDQVYTATNAISTLVLPQATGGDGALAYTLTVAADGGDVPAGLSFNAADQTLSGTPSETQAATEYAYTVTDSDATDPDSVTLNFDITVLAASAVTISGDTTGDIVEDGGDTDTGTLTVSNSDPAGSTDVVAQTDAPGTYGGFSITANGVWTYTLDNVDDDTDALAAGAEVMDTFTVTAAADPAVIEMVTITITGANDAPTVTISAPADDTDVEFGTALTLTATGEDPDTGTTLSYAWSANPDVGSFADAAVASTTWTAPASGTAPVTLTLTVTDDATPPLSGTAEVTVNPVAAATPSAAIATPSSLTEATLAGATVTVMLANTEYVGTLTANLFTVTLSGGATGVSVSAVTRTSAMLATLTLAYGGTGIDANTTLGVRVGAAAHSGAGDLDTATIPLTATPPSLPGATFSVAENAAANTPVGTPLVPDNFPAGSQTWAIVSGNTGNDFAINPSTGQLTVAADDSINFEDTPSYTLEVSLTIGAATAQATVTVTVTDVDEPPAAPAAPTVAPAAESLNVSWTAPANSGPAITGYDVEYRLTSLAPSGAYTDAGHSGTTTSLTIPGLTASVAYQVRVRATNAEGDGPYSALGTGTPLAAGAPTAAITTTVPGTLTEANLDGAMLTVMLSNATYMGTLTMSQFTLAGAPVAAMISVASVTAVSGSGTQAVLVLAYPDAGADLDNDLNLSVVVAAAAHTGTNPLTTSSVTVTDNAAPVIVNPGSQTYVQGMLITPLMITVTDTDTPTITVLGLPTGLLFNRSQNQITGTPDATVVAMMVTITADDSVNDMVTETFTITVNAPAVALGFSVATIPAQTYTMGSAITDLTLPVATGGTGTLSYSLSGMPSGLAFDATTRVLSGTPDAAQAATSYTYTATDADSTTATLDLVITVNAPAVALTFGGETIPAQTYTMGSAITDLTLPVATGGTGTLSYSLSGMPSGLNFNAVTRVLSGTPNAAQAATSYTYTATDADSTTATLDLVITVNAPAVALTFGGETIPAQTYTMGSAITDLTLPTASGGTGTLSYSLSGMPSGLNFNAVTRVLSGTPNAAQAATSYTYTATDAATSPAMIMLTFTIEVTPALSFSVATIPAQTYTMGSAITDLTLPTADGGTGTLSYSLSGMPSGLGFDATTRVLSGTPDAVQAATTYTYTATDAATPPATVMLDLVITVVAPATPIISGTLADTLVEDAPTTMATGTLAISNPGSGATTFTPQTDTPGIYGGFSIVAGGGWSYALNNSATATNALAAGARVTDAFEVRAVNAAIAPATVTISITGANDAPTATASATPLSVASGGTVALTGGGVDPDTGAALVFQWSAAGNVGTFTNADMANAGWDAPRLDSTASIVITLTVSDGTASAVATVDIEVMGNQPSVISGDLTGAASVAVPTATGTLTSSDSDGPDNSFTAATGIAGMFGTLSITDAGAWSYTLDITDADTIALAAAQTADDVLTISAADGTEATLTITVTGANDPPLADAGGDQRQGQGATVTLDGTASSDPDGGASLSYAWAQSSGTPTVTLSGQATATATFTAPELPPGTDSLQLGFTLTVTDGTVTVSDTVSITITNQPSVVGGDLSGRVSENAPTATGTLTSSDPDGPDNMFMAANDLAGIYGTLDITVAGTWRYELDLTDEDTMELLAAGQTGEDAIMISTADGTAATITIRVGQREEARREALEMTLGAFGRSFTSGAVEVLGERFSSGAGGSQLTFGGRTLSLESLRNGQAAANAGDESDNQQPVPAAAGGHQTSVGALFAGSAFQLSLNEGNDAGVGATTLWARGAVGNYEGEPEDGFQLDGDIVSGYLGLDYRPSRRMLVGVAVSHSRGDADFSSADIADGEVETDLTSILPYVQWQARPGLSVWGLVGYGEGESEITDSGESRKTDVEMKTAALGARGKLWSGGRADVALKASALTVELESDSEQNLSSVTTRAHRLRMALAGNRHGAASARGGRFGQRFELGLRWDLGDVETGAGADLGAGVEYANPRSGTRLRLDGHYLLVHEETDFEAWEVSAAISIDPGVRGRGVRFALEPNWESTGARQRMVMDFTNVLGPAWRDDGLKLELYGERAEEHEFGLEGSFSY